MTEPPSLARSGNRGKIPGMSRFDTKGALPLLVVGALFLFTCGVWSMALAQEPVGKGYLTFAVLDIGQGDALYIESPTGIQVLVDAGPGSAVLQALPTVMPALDRSLDAVVATHPDADHIGGFVDLLPRYDIGAYIEPGIIKDTATAKKVLAEVAEQKIPRVVARRGMTMDLGGGAILEVLYPDRDVTYIGSDKANEGAIVMRLNYGATCALLMSDVGAGVEGNLISLTNPNCDILKVGHHGSRFSSSDAFVKEVSPSVAIISVGKNSYGHPTPQALGVLKKYGAEILRTDQSGTVVCTSDAAQFTCR